MSISSVVQAVKKITLETGKEWLIVGKGPSSDHINRVSLDGFSLLTLNHACNIVEPTIAHFVDIEAFDQCYERLSSLTCLVCLPWHPHQKFRAAKQTLCTYSRVTALGNRVVSYNASNASGHTKNPELPVIRLRYFSVVGAFNILADAGIKTIHTIGVDGGTEYGRAFNTETKLANGQQSFDIQTKELQRTVDVNKCDWRKFTR